MKHSWFEILLFLLFLLLFQSRLTGTVYEQSLAKELQAEALEKEEFRAMTISESCIQQMQTVVQQTNLTEGEALTIIHAEKKAHHGNKITLSDTERLLHWKQFLTNYNAEGYAVFTAAYGAVWNDLICFPVAEQGMTFENSWMFERNYGGKRGHEGTDIMPPENISGYYRVVSMTDGVVEQIGWLPKGGYRIGIRAPSGGYFYYAHLEAYSRVYQIGETVTAGEVLGTMGDTGYGEEGTHGQFPVHLHLGIYIRTKLHEELSVNPYWILRYLSDVS